MKVLSLFDGISCGMVALERAGIPVDAYYASEIDKNAIAISQKNYPDIIRLGDVTRWREWDIPWAEIDLLIGGSPCQGFSFAGKQLNFNDPRSKLFFEFVDILNHIKKHNPNVKFLLENVVMKKQYEDVISDCLGCKPICIDSEIITPMRRKRLYWFNFGVADIVEKPCCLKDILECDVDLKYFKNEEQFNKITYTESGCAHSKRTEGCITMDVREKLVELLNEVQETGVNEIPAGFGCTREYVKNEKVASHLIANGITVQEWISVDDRLPQNFVSVLGYMTDAGEFPPVRECYTVGNAFFFPALGDVHPVSHWCELPQPPKGE